MLQVELLHQDGIVSVNSVKPLRERALTGTITRYSHGNGIIDDDIFFTLSSCCHGYRPLVGQSVNVVCVECVHQKWNWRAYDVRPSDQDVETRFEQSYIFLTLILFLHQRRSGTLSCY